MTRFLFTQNLAVPPPEWVSLLGSGFDLQPGFPPVDKQTSLSIPVSSITIAAGESIVVGMAMNSNNPPPKTAGWTATDNLGNTYTCPASHPIAGLDGGLACGLLICLNPTPGVLTGITVSWTTPVTYDGPLAALAHRFRGLQGRSIESLANPTFAAHSFTTPNEVLTQAGDPGGIGIAITAIRTQGISGDPYAGSSAVLIGSETSGGHGLGSISDSSHVQMCMAYAQPVPATGIGQPSLHWTGGSFCSAGVAYL